MTNEELDEARAKEAGGDPVKAARLARENWTPPEPVVDPDVLAFREWFAGIISSGLSRFVPRGDYDASDTCRAFLAGARRAREQEQKRAKVLVEFAKSRVPLTDAADVALAKYRGEA